LSAGAAFEEEEGEEEGARWAAEEGAACASAGLVEEVGAKVV
jgi:hypothetical protein